MRRPGPGTRIGSVAVRTVALLLLAAISARADMRMAINPTKLHLSLEPGSSRTQTVEVSNNGENPLRVVAYVVDWTAPREGGMQFLPPGSVDRSASAWVEPDLPEFIVPPQESRIVRVSASLPDTARGSYWALLFFEGEGAPRRGRLGVATKARMGTTMYLTATGTELREDALTGMEIERTADSDTLRLVTSVANRGNVHYYPDGWFQVLDDGGQVLFEEKLPLRVLLPGRETVYRIPWLPESAGARRLVATIDSGVETLMQGIKRFTVPVDTAPEPPAVPQPVIVRAAQETASPEYATPAPDRAAPATPEVSAPLYGLHVESFATAEEVAVAKRRYLGMNYPVTVKTVDLGDNGVWHRIIVGRFAQESEAREFGRELEDTFHLDFLAVTRLDP